MGLGTGRRRARICCLRRGFGGIGRCEIEEWMGSIWLFSLPRSVRGEVRYGMIPDIGLGPITIGMEPWYSMVWYGD